MVEKRAFSLYDIEQFLKEAGAERVNEKAVISLEKELRDTANELIQEASMYANYAGRKKMIKASDIELLSRTSGHAAGRARLGYPPRGKRRQPRMARGRGNARVSIVDNMPLVTEPVQQPAQRRAHANNII